MSSVTIKGRTQCLKVEWHRFPTHFPQNRSTFAARLSYNADSMNTVRCTFRCLITAGLLLSLSTVSLFPRIMVGEALGSTVSAGTGEKHCCCGTKDGRCCGMGCCQASPNPEENQAPAAPKPSEDRGQPLGPFLVANAAVLGPNTAAFRDGFFRDAASKGGSSLIALSIRLNV